METIFDIRPYAKANISSGVTVIPLLPRQKAPDTSISHPHQAHVNKEEDVGVYFKPENNMGLACGSESMDVVVVDFDLKDDPKLAEVLKAFEAEHSEILSKLIKVKTGGGCHYYLRGADPSAYNNGDFYICDHKMGQIRTNGGYVVMPPSLHPNGKRYTYERFIPFAKLPLVELSKLGIIQRREMLILMPQPQEERSTRKPAVAPNLLTAHLLNKLSGGKTKNTYMEKVIENTRERILGAVEGERNQTINGEIYSLGRLIPVSDLTRERIFSELFDDALSLYDPDNPEDASDIKHLGSVFNSAIEAGMKNPKEIRSIGRRSGYWGMR